jgi:S1-C subfamily serine protease
LGLESTVADGLVSSWRKDEKGLKLLQVSVPLSNGSSGGPIFDLDGNVIGVTSASSLRGQNLNFAIPINYVKSLLRRAQAPAQGSRTQRKEYVQRINSKDRTPLSFRQKNGLYTIKPNDTLYDLARRYNTSVHQIMAINNLPDTRIYRGQKIRLPMGR